ncbi:hypothetical protein NKI36_24905 [Mesorhizobium caraganae]|uniref:Transposase n=1 Tax=Mesorhizobium caraganae TaxID=483206 RepID=A0ABV1Z5D0_9HYPH
MAFWASVTEPLLTVLSFSGLTAGCSEFAEEQGVAPGIVFGQLQHMKVLKYSQMNELKARYAWIE